MKLELKTYEGKSKVLIDGVDLSEKITGIDIQIRGGEVPVAILEIPVNCIDIEGDFRVFKDVAKPINNTDWINKLAKF